MRERKGSYLVHPFHGSNHLISKEGEEKSPSDKILYHSSSPFFFRRHRQSLVCRDISCDRNKYAHRRTVLSSAHYICHSKLTVGMERYHQHVSHLLGLPQSVGVTEMHYVEASVR